MIQDWYEIWIDESTDIPYVVFLSPSKTSQLEEILIIDPNDGGKVIETMPSYEAAKLWLQEDEFILVKGRMLIQ